MKKQPQNSSKLKAKATSKTAPSQTTVKRKEEKALGPTLFEKFETFALKRERILMWVAIGLSILCSLFLFDLKVSIGGDDSAYVERAYNFIHKGVYPYYQGPGYPLVIALLMKVFGFNIPVFKLFSLIFYTAHIVLTWSEAFYMFVQAVVLWITMKAVALKKPEGSVGEDLKKSWYLWLGIGLAFALLAMTKTVAIFGIAAPVIYFITQKKFRFAIYIALSFLIFRIGIGQVEKATFGPNTSNQWEQMMLKDAYKKEQGTLDAAGFIGRFGENLKTYSSMHFFRFLHIIPQDRYKLSEDGTNPSDEQQLGWLVTVMVTLLILYSSYRIFKENKEAFFLVLFTLVMCGGIFFGIHANNRQDRLIIILFPFILMIIGYGLYITAKNFRILQVLIAGLFGIVLLSSFYHTLAKTPESITCLQKNLGNEPYYGYTQDWINYLEMGDWCVKNLPEGSIVACRKPTISFITTGKQIWYGVHTVESEDGDYWLKKFKDAGVTHILVADLRAIPHKKTNRIISTMHKVGTFILQKYPQNPNKLKLVHVVGTEEKAQLFEIMY